MKKYILIISSCLLFYCCSSQKENNHFLVNSSFSDVQIKQLALFLHKFDEAVCQTEKQNNLQNCYNSFFKSLTAVLDKELSEEIWTEWWAIKNKAQDNEYETFHKKVNIKGKYFDFLEKEVAKGHPIIQENIHVINNVGDLTPFLFTSILMRYEEFDITDENVRLLIAIHYLGVNAGHLYSKSGRINLDK